jgi:hypothetical protein
MIIYNVTTKVAHSIHPDWVNWMKTEHIPAVMRTGCFTNHYFVQLLETDEEDGATYAVQYHAGQKEDYDRYIREFSDLLRKEAIGKWGNQMIAFRSLMQVVN